MTEYAILVGFLVMGLAAVFGAFPRAISIFAFDVVKVLALPIM